MICHGSPHCEQDVDGPILHAPWCPFSATAEPEPAPTIEDYCESTAHAYYGDDLAALPGSPEEATIGRCYCGERTYPAGGPTMPPPTGVMALEFGDTEPEKRSKGCCALPWNATGHTPDCEDRCPHCGSEGNDNDHRKGCPTIGTCAQTYPHIDRPWHWEPATPLPDFRTWLDAHLAEFHPGERRR